MSNDTNRKGPSEQSDNVWHTTYIQNPALTENSDVQHEVDLYYTDLDPLAKAELFMDEGDAIIKAKKSLNFFPTECIKLYTFNWEFSGTDILEHMYQIVPKGTNTPGTNAKAGLRRVTRKHLKELYDKIDYVRIERPKNTIKWYEVSREELQDYISIVQEFYGLTNFPDKVGDYYFSKKIGRWLATDKIDAYETKHGGAIEKIDLNDITAARPGVSRTTLLQKFRDFFIGLGKKLKAFFGIFFSEDLWNNTVNFIFGNDLITKIFEATDNELQNGTFINDVIANIKSDFLSFLHNPIGTGETVGENSGTIPEAISGLLGDTSKFIEDLVKDIGNAIGGTASSILGKINDILSGKVGGSSGSLLNRLNSILGDIGGSGTLVSRISTVLNKIGGDDNTIIDRLADLRAILFTRGTTAQNADNSNLYQIAQKIFNAINGQSDSGNIISTLKGLRDRTGEGPSSNLAEGIQSLKSKFLSIREKFNDNFKNLLPSNIWQTIADWFTATFGWDFDN